MFDVRRSTCQCPLQIPSCAKIIFRQGGGRNNSIMSYQSGFVAIIGAPNPILFGFLASVLTFIPYVGIMIASLLPIAAVWVTYDSAWYAIAVIAWFAFVQILEAYLIFPYIVGKNLKINTLVIIIMIILGGMLWGAAGMILFIPLISILKLIADRSPKLQFISALLGE
jgi:predicted PurR-regulated permease PerM